MRSSRSLRLTHGVIYLSTRVFLQTRLLALIIIPYIINQYTSVALTNTSEIFTKDLFDKYAVNDSIGVKELETLVRNVQNKYVVDVLNKYFLVEDGWEQQTKSNVQDVCKGLDKGTPEATECITNMCLSSYDAFYLYNFPPDKRLSQSEFSTILPAILFEAQKQDCEIPNLHTAIPSSAKVWGYGILFVTIINVCSMGGALVLPFTKKSMYKKVLTFLVGLAVGSLAANGLMVLIPESLHLFPAGQSRVPIVLKGLAIFSGIYLFFLIERMLKMFMSLRQRRNHENRNDYHGHSHGHSNYNNGDDDRISDLMCSVKVHEPQKYDESRERLNKSVTAMNKLKDPSTVDVSTNCNGPHSGAYKKIEGSGDDHSPDTMSTDNSQVHIANGHAPHTPENKKYIASIAWMIIFGDGLHNFIDGLAMGAAFTQKILTGVSVSMAIICEEIPHELGDFAILLKAGMTFKQAMLFNFLSACTCYLGLIGGILLGENTHAHEWIFALAGGMFLYISLVDMLPEMNSSAEEEEREQNTVCSLSVFVLQNLGIVMGLTVIAIMTLYAEEINFAT